MSEKHALVADTEHVTAGRITLLRRGAFLGYRWLLVFLLAGVVRIFLAGLGVFRLQGQGLIAEVDSALAPHRDLGFTMARPRRPAHPRHRGLPVYLVTLAGVVGQAL